MTTLISDADADADADVVFGPFCSLSGELLECRVQCSSRISRGAFFENNFTASFWKLITRLLQLFGGQTVITAINVRIFGVLCYPSSEANWSFC